MEKKENRRKILSSPMGSDFSFGKTRRIVSDGRK